MSSHPYLHLFNNLSYRKVHEVTTPSADNTWQKKAIAIGAQDEVTIFIEVISIFKTSKLTSKQISPATGTTTNVRLCLCSGSNRNINKIKGTIDGLADQIQITRDWPGRARACHGIPPQAI